MPEFFWLLPVGFALGAYGTLIGAGGGFLLVPILLLMYPRDSRRLVEADGTVHTYAYNPVLGVGLSLIVGFLSRLLGIGGGIIHVPIMVNLLHFPVHVATATSHFTLAIMALTGSAVHTLEGDFVGVFGRIVPLSIGVAAGAQLGAGLARWIGGVWIIRALVAALAFVGIRLIVLGGQGG